MDDAIVNSTVTINICDEYGSRDVPKIPRVPPGYCVFRQDPRDFDNIFIITGGEELTLRKTANGGFRTPDGVTYDTVYDFLTQHNLAIFPVTQEVTGPCALQSKHKCCHSLYRTTVKNGFIITTSEVPPTQCYWTGGDYIMNEKIVTYFPDHAGVDRFVRFYSMR